MLDWQHGQCIQTFLAHGVACECLIKYYYYIFIFFSPISGYPIGKVWIHWPFCQSSMTSEQLETRNWEISDFSEFKTTSSDWENTEFFFWTVIQLGIPSRELGPLSRAHKKDRRATFLFKWAQHNKVSPKIYCMLLHKWCNMPRRYVYCSQESNTKCMLCSKLLVAHVPHPNNLVPFPPHNLAYCSDLVVHM